MPIIAFLLRPCFLSDANHRGVPPARSCRCRGVEISYVTTILDMDQLFQDAQGWRRRAIRHRVTDRFPSAIEMQAAAAIFRVLSPGQPPKQRQAAAPRAILARIVSITRGFAIQFRQGVAEPAVGLFIVGERLNAQQPYGAIRLLHRERLLSPGPMPARALRDYQPVDFRLAQTCLRQPRESRQRQAISDCQRKVGLRFLTQLQRQSGRRVCERPPG